MRVNITIIMIAKRSTPASVGWIIVNILLIIYIIIRRVLLVCPVLNDGRRRSHRNPLKKRDVKISFFKLFSVSADCACTLLFVINIIITTVVREFRSDYYYYYFRVVSWSNGKTRSPTHVVYSYVCFIFYFFFGFRDDLLPTLSYRVL